MRFWAISRPLGIAGFSKDVIIEFIQFLDEGAKFIFAFSEDKLQNRGIAPSPVKSLECFMTSSNDQVVI